MKDRRDK